MGQGDVTVGFISQFSDRSWKCAQQEMPREKWREVASDAVSFVHDEEFLVNLPTVFTEPLDWIADGKLPRRIFQVFGNFATVPAVALLALIEILNPVAERRNAKKIVGDGGGIVVFQVSDETFSDNGGVLCAGAKVGEKFSTL